MVLQAIQFLCLALIATLSWAQTDDVLPTAPPDAPAARPSMELLGQSVQAGLRARLSWRTGFGYGLNEEPVPVLVSHGRQPGPVLCLTAAVHGDELNGIEIVRRVMTLAKPEDLQGTVIGVPVVNVHGFHRRSRYLPDRRDLNRHFPGSAQGSFASRVAYDFFTRVISRCDILVDVHTGSFYRSNLPQLRADLRDESVLDLTQYFGAMTVLHSRPAQGTLRRAAQDSGVPAVTMEVGEPNRLQAEDVALAVRGLKTLLAGLDMIGSRPMWDRAQPVYYESEWVRADRGGILFSTVELGQKVGAGEVLGTVTDPLSNVYVEIASPIDGRVLGKALNQFVMPGFAAFRIGVETPEPEVVLDSRQPPAEEPSDDSALEQPDISPSDEQERLP